MSCSAYCAGDWAGCSDGSCIAAVDNSTSPNSWIGCDTVRGVKTAQVTCFCTGCIGAHARPAMDSGFRGRGWLAAQHPGGLPLKLLPALHGLVGISPCRDVHSASGRQQITDDLNLLPPAGCSDVRAFARTRAHM